MSQKSKTVLLVALTTLHVAQPRVARAQAPDKKSDVAPDRAGAMSKNDVAELRGEVQDLKSLMIRLLEIEEQRLNAIHQVVREMKEGAVVRRSAPPESTSKIEEQKVAPKPREGGEVGTISGRVTVAKVSGTPTAYVYVEDINERLARNKAEEIRQVDKQFVPQVLVVQRGTRVTFPNQDNIFHNVFSLTQGSAFDLGSYRSGDKPGSYVFTETGVVEIFCNLHSQMNASVLVVPNHYFARVSADGKFQITSIPKGKHRLIAWTPNVAPVVKPVTVKPGQDTSIEFALEGQEGAPKHSDKFGMPYGSYQ
jgi:plastocyanin